MLFNIAPYLLWASAIAAFSKAMASAESAIFVGILIGAEADHLVLSLI
jgi:hypothetical protein